MNKNLTTTNRSTIIITNFTLVLLTLLLGLTSKSTAQILPVTQVTCTGLETQTYTPGLTYEVRDSYLELQANLICTSLSNPTIISSVRTVSATLPRSCNDLLNGGTAVVKTTWNTGEVSMEQATYTASYSAGQFVLVGQGSIIQGKFLGSPTANLMTLTADLTACSTEEGLTSSNGPVVFDILL